MKNSYTQIHYNEELRPYTEFPRLLCEHLSDKYFKARTGKLLDVCCGRGEFIEIYKDLGFDAYGVDMDSVALQKGLNVKIADVDNEDLPFEDDFFDVIVMKSAIEHIRNIYHLMENLRRVLKPGGKLIILTCDWKRNFKVFFDDVDHKSPFTTFSLHDVLVRYDFKNVVAEDIYYLPFSWKNRVYKFIPGIISRLFPIDFPQTVKLNPFVKMVKFSREKQIIGYGEK
ncbi:MAG: class I SAM-dependent methyltransferase [Candidatus Omnitrophica bacterium]|nr:class I SAM-dependent methyltransferase [Candidatus Omnitrophota bacterium]